MKLGKYKYKVRQYKLLRCDYAIKHTHVLYGVDAEKFILNAKSNRRASDSELQTIKNDYQQIKQLFVS